MDTQKILPYLWFDKQAEDAANLYTGIFPDSRITRTDRYSKAMAEAAGNTEGAVLTVSFELAGQSFVALNGGPYFPFTPAVSFSVNCASRDEIDAFWAKLLPGGQVLMDLDAYPFSERYGWLQDKFGVSWQLILSEPSSHVKIEPCLLFVGDQLGKAREAMDLYTSLLPESGVSTLNLYQAGEESREGTVKHARFTLAGQSFVAMESDYAHAFTFTPAISFLISCSSQDEVDRLWDALSKGGAVEQCGWLRDPFGISWQIVPDILDTMMHDPDPVRAERVAAAMLGMVKLDFAGLQKAYDGN